MLSVHLKNGRVGLRDIAKPARERGDALIRLLCAGICNTDLELQRGYYDFTGVPGHEFVGEVVEADAPEWIGKRVVGEINLACGECATCRRGLGRHCPHRSVLGIVRRPGAFQEYFTLPERNLHEVPNEIPTESAVFVEPLAAACEILDQVAIPCSSGVAVLGDGKLGLLIALVLNAHGYRVHHFGKHPGNLAISRRAGVITEAHPPLPKDGFDWVIEATGSPDGLSTAVGITQPRGTVVIKSTLHGAVAVDTSKIIVDEITLLGSRCGRFEPALELLRLGTIDVSELIAARLTLRDAPKAFELAAQKGVLKVLLTP